MQCSTSLPQGSPRLHTTLSKQGPRSSTVELWKLLSQQRSCRPPRLTARPAAQRPPVSPHCCLPARPHRQAIEKDARYSPSTALGHPVCGSDASTAETSYPGDESDTAHARSRSECSFCGRTTSPRRPRAEAEEPRVRSWAPPCPKVMVGDGRRCTLS